MTTPKPSELPSVPGEVPSVRELLWHIETQLEGGPVDGHVFVAHRDLAEALAAKLREGDAAARERDTLATENESLRARVEELEARLERTTRLADTMLGTTS